MVAITPAAMHALDAIRPAGVGGEVKVFVLRTFHLNVDSRKPTIEPSTWPTLPPPFTNRPPRSTVPRNWTS